MKAEDLQLDSLFSFEAGQGRISMGSNRMLMIDAEAMGRLRKELIDTLGWKVARGVLMRYGYRCGAVDAVKLGERYSWDTDLDWLMAGPLLHRLEGVAEVEVTRLDCDRKMGRIHGEGIWRDSYEAQEHLKLFGRAEGPVCWTLCGHASGYASLVMGKEVICLEKACVGAGHPFCHWEVRPAESWGAGQSEVRDALRSLDLRRHMDTMLRNEKLASISTFAAGLAHEIKNPLNAALIQLHLLERRVQKQASPNSEECLRTARIVREEIARLNHLVDDFLLFARPSDIRQARVDFPRFLDQVVEKVLPAEPPRQQAIRLERDLPASLPQVWMDESKMAEAFVHLLNNAIEAMSRGGTIRISATVEEGQLRIVVADEGEGIPESIRPHIFDVFFSTKQSGTGLGLPIALRIIEEHRGNLELMPATAKGTAFAITLPTVERESPVASPVG
ncbi:MAG: XylR N-terminal domain-containing protein [Planctomycetes bacterium]|nr:XylR N-terminal domain-containing protein [Planctomycetota bacterium]